MAPVAPPPPKPGESSAAYHRRVQAWRARHEAATMRVFTAVLICFLIFMAIAFIAALSYQPRASADRPQESHQASYPHPDRLSEFVHALEARHDD
ncbi:hypothetical protein [Deinococcus soli (ex Cha et al. 2016)]|uniref:hypothetical protein n=1 Tax=Deinococcus soli (ex Cha et al. 2016) TaxID=1309411 RepID=UPI00166551BE|nr:hypothetical protein [Deinococcus soli (ex Cha et al. 2016)]GGB64719.1 hypothetical protein GCM10008019_21050 [Deinococcus soli (ex Cha et al. 2016)]